MSFSSEVLALSPLRYYPLSEASGISLDDASTNNVAATLFPNSGGTWTGGSLGATGADGGDTAADFNGSSGYADLGDLPIDGLTKATFIFRVKADTTGGFRTLFSKYDNDAVRFEVQLGDASLGYATGLAISVGASTVLTPAGGVATSQYQVVVVVYDGTQATNSARVKTYYGDSLQTCDYTYATSIPTSIPAMSTTHAYVGARSGGAYFYDGPFDDFAVLAWVALTQEQITTLVSGSGGSATLTAATVQANGAKIDLTFDTTAAPTVGQLIVTADGHRLPVSAVSGSGASWTATLGQRWVRSGRAVQVAYNGAAALTATNSSTVLDRQVKYVGRKFEMFIHFSIETFLDVEWSDPAASINSFAPTGNISDAIDQWVSSAISCGMECLVLTVKHHSGFCLWPSASSARNLSNTTWYSGAGSPDIVRLFVDKCRAAGLGIGLYFSIWDRWWESQNPGWTNAAFKTFVQAQLAELLTQYGAIDALWFDGYGNGWTPPTGIAYTTLAIADSKGYVQTLQPECVVVVNNHEFTTDNSDIIAYEYFVDGSPPAGRVYPTEQCRTINSDNNWFWKLSDAAPISLSTIAGDLVALNSNRCALLLNCPPNRSGFLPAATVARLLEVGGTELERVGGISDSAGTLHSRTVTIPLTTNGTTPAATESGIKWAWYDTPYPMRRGDPTSFGADGSIDGSGNLVVTVQTRLGSGGWGWIEASSNDGTTGSAWYAHTGPAQVA